MIVELARSAVFKDVYGSGAGPRRGPPGARDVKHLTRRRRPGATTRKDAAIDEAPAGDPLYVKAATDATACERTTTNESSNVEK
jgi:hypothetical protein